MNPTMRAIASMAALIGDIPSPPPVATGGLPRRNVTIPSVFGELGLCICAGCRNAEWRPYRIYLRHLASARKNRRGWR